MKEPKVTTERRGEIVQKILEILNENHEGLHRNELLKQLEQRVVLTEHESGFYDEEKQNRRFEQMITEKLIRQNTDQYRTPLWS